MAHQVTVTRSAQIQVVVSGIPSYRFTLTASAGVNTPNQIWRMLQRPLDPLAQTTTADFDGVCTPFDLQNLPINAPNPPGDEFRVAAVDITYTDQNVGEQAWTEIQQDVQLLIDALNAGDNLGNVSVIIFS